MALEKKLRKGEALKIKPETHRVKGEGRRRTKSTSEWTKLCREWSKRDANLRALGKAIMTWGFGPKAKSSAYRLPEIKPQTFFSGSHLKALTD